MKIEARYYSDYVWKELCSAECCDERDVPKEVSDLVHQCITHNFRQARQAAVDHEAVKNFCILAGKALGLAKPLCADDIIEITEYQQGEIVFEMQDLYISKDTRENETLGLREIAQKADRIFVDSGAHTVRFAFYFKLSKTD